MYFNNNRMSSNRSSSANREYGQKNGAASYSIGHGIFSNLSHLRGANSHVQSSDVRMLTKSSDFKADKTIFPQDTTITWKDVSIALDYIFFIVFLIANIISLIYSFVRMVNNI